MPRKKHEEEHHGSSERWLLTYADMITLLMAFFIMMYSMSVLNLAKFQSVAFSIRSGFGGMLKGQGKHLMEHQSAKGEGEQAGTGTEERAMRRLTEQLTSSLFLEEFPPGTQVYREERGVVISIAVDNLLFARGGATLLPEALPPLTRVAGILRRVPHKVVVEGHTCPLPIATAAFPSNWELSSARACTVVRFLVEQGLDARRLRAVGYGETLPRAPNTSEGQRAMNRRVDIVVLDRADDGWQQGESSLSSTTPKVDVDLPRIKPVIPKVWD